jgi:hypothetical protein
VEVFEPNPREDKYIFTLSSLMLKKKYIYIYVFQDNQMGILFRTVAALCVPVVGLTRPEID